MELAFDLIRNSAFQHACSACSKCCSDKGIPISPYELSRISRSLSLSTTQFLASYTHPGGIFLASRENGACVFLGADGCSIHPNRPLACRLYPLARKTDASGENFAKLPLETGCEAQCNGEGTVQDYLREQGVEPYFAWGDRYRSLFQFMAATLEELEVLSDSSLESSESRCDTEDSLLSPWLDVDACVSQYCLERNLAFPEALEDLLELHLEAMGAWVKDLSESEHSEA
jgi:uncharacterized protein